VSEKARRKIQEKATSEKTKNTVSTIDTKGVQNVLKPSYIKQKHE